MNKPRLIVLFQQLYEHTEPECGKSCRRPHSCCSPEYCAITVAFAQQEWGVTLEPTGHEKLPLMGSEGCIAAPHLRPLCTAHTCAINNLGYKPNDQEWTDTYFKLRDAIDEEANEEETTRDSDQR